MSFWNKRSKFKKEGLHEIIKRRGVAAIIFVHGLQGHPFKTWTKKNCDSLPHLFEKDESFKRYDIYTFGYNTGFYLKRHHFKEISSLLYTEIKARLQNEEIYFVSHSMGGLVVQSLLIEQVERQNTDFTRRVKGIVYLSVPFAGSEVASLASAAYTFIPPFIGDHTVSSQVRSLRVLSKDLADNATKWVRYTNLQHIKIREKNIYGVSDKAVSSISSNPPYIQDTDSVEEDHKSICKIDPRSTVYFLLVQFFSHIAQEEYSNAGKSSEINYQEGQDDLLEKLLMCSKILLEYPSTLRGGQKIERPEMDKLLQIINENINSTTMVLGGKGSGKTSLLSSLGQILYEQTIPIVCIKADMLSNAVNTFSELSKDLFNLSIDIRDAIKRLSTKGKVVILIDQLDAVSELLDQKSGRLNVLLNLIQSMSNIKDVHIITTCREFEFRHDVRLNSIEANRIDLELPTWETISAVLIQQGRPTEKMGQTLKELLRVPLHLKIFLDIEYSDEEFWTHQNLLDKLWSQKITTKADSKDRLMLLEKIAIKMMSEETLWLPTAIIDSETSVGVDLELEEILMRGKNSTIGFRHQTYYDYTLARAFARESLELSDYVLSKQNGLFVRPTLLSGLNYLRGTSTGEYHRQINKLFKSTPRLHIWTLLIEFIGEQKDPSDEETSLLFSLLESDLEGVRVLSAISESLGWYKRIVESEGFAQWLLKPLDQAIYCIPILSKAARSGERSLITLLHKFWFENIEYDSLSLKILSEYTNWDLQIVKYTEVLVRRNESNLSTLVIDQIIDSVPKLAPRILRIELERRLKEILKYIGDISNQPRSESDINAVFFDNTYTNLEKLLTDNSDWENLNRLAKEATNEFLEWIWPWFHETVKLLAYSEHEFVTGYRSDSLNFRVNDEDDYRSSILSTVFNTIIELANTDSQAFIKFVLSNVSSDLMIVHRIISSGLIKIASLQINVDVIFNYLTNDVRSLTIGDDYGNLSRTLISYISPILNRDKLDILEKQICDFKRYNTGLPDWDVTDRKNRLIWNREHRLALLRAIPISNISSITKKLLDEENRAFPDFDENRDSYFGGDIGPRLTSEELFKAKDNQILDVFSELPDESGWDHPKRQEMFHKDYSRAGGAVQLSREFEKMVQNDIKRAIKILSELEPKLHETYAGKGLEGLTKTDILKEDFFDLFEMFELKGFMSNNYRENAASALEKFAFREGGLPDHIIDILINWLPGHTYPEDKDYESDFAKAWVKDSMPILFGPGRYVLLPGGRGTFLRAIAIGYLKRIEPSYEKWVTLIRNRIGVETHPAVWADTMKYLYPSKEITVTEIILLINDIIITYPKVVEYGFFIRYFSRIMGEQEVKVYVRDWFEIFLKNDHQQVHQAYGELLFIYYLHHQDEWSKNRIHEYTRQSTDENILLGLTFAASHCWENHDIREMATEILVISALQGNQKIQDAMVIVFRLNIDCTELTEEMMLLITTFCSRGTNLRKACTYITDIIYSFTAQKPSFVIKVVEHMINNLGTESNNLNSPLALIAENLTNIALTLHRQSTYREEGLKLFEKLLLLNLRETRNALETLDRRISNPSSIRAGRNRRSRPKVRK